MNEHSTFTGFRDKYGLKFHDRQVMEAYIGGPEGVRGNIQKAYQHVFPKAYDSVARNRGAMIVRRAGASKLLQERTEEAANEAGVTKKLVFQLLKAEATRDDKGASHSARVQSISLMAKYLGMDAPPKKEDNDDVDHEELVEAAKREEDNANAIEGEYEKVEGESGESGEDGDGDGDGDEPEFDEFGYPTKGKGRRTKNGKRVGRPQKGGYYGDDEEKEKVHLSPEEQYKDEAVDLSDIIGENGEQ